MIWSFVFYFEKVEISCFFKRCSYIIVSLCSNIVQQCWRQNLCYLWKSFQCIHYNLIRFSQLAIVDSSNSCNRLWDEWMLLLLQYVHIYIYIYELYIAYIYNTPILVTRALIITPPLIFVHLLSLDSYFYTFLSWVPTSKSKLKMILKPAHWYAKQINCMVSI